MTNEIKFERNLDSEFDTFLAKHLQAPQNYIEDEGFSARVMAGLPKPYRINPLLEKTILWLPVLLISLLVLSQFPWRELVHNGYAFLLTMSVVHILKISLALMGVFVALPVIFGAKRRLLTF